MPEPTVTPTGDYRELPAVTPRPKLQYVVKANRYFGPFLTAGEAATWVEQHGGISRPWSIIPIEVP